VLGVEDQVGVLGHLAEPPGELVALDQGPEKKGGGADHRPVRKPWIEAPVSVAVAVIGRGQNGSS